MSMPDEWERRILYAFLIGKRDRNRSPISTDTITDTLHDLFERLKSSVGGICKMKPFEAAGETAVWGPEPTTVVLVLVQITQEEATDSIIAGEAGWLAHALAQDEVWVTKQELGLHIGRDFSEGVG